jgi:hypothetical protein
LRWYANVPLSVETNTSLNISYQNGGMTEKGSLQWLPLNVLIPTSQLVRTGDSLLLTARSTQPATVQITILNGSQTVATYNTTASQPVPHQFTSAGTYTVKAIYTPRAGASRTGSITVKVVGYDFPSNPACMPSDIRNWPLTNVPPEVVLQYDPRLRLVQTNLNSLSLLIDQNLPRTVVARFGNQGPILNSTRAEGMLFFGTEQTYNTVIEHYPDGIRLVETMEILSPVLPNVTVQIRVIVGGVTFDDGTIFKELTAGDFDALGQCKIRFLMPAGTVTANCHSIKILQGTAHVGGD